MDMIAITLDIAKFLFLVPANDMRFSRGPRPEELQRGRRRAAARRLQALG